MADEQIRFDIIFNTRAAVDQIAAMSASAQSLEDRVTKFGNFLIQSSKKWGVPIKELQRDFANLDSELKSMGKAGGLPEGIFPGSEKSSDFTSTEIFELSDAYVRATQAANGFRVSQDGVVTSISHVTPAVQKLSVAIANLQKPARNAKGQFLGGTDFGNQFNNLTTYQDKLQLVQNTIQKLAQSTGSSFKDSGAALTKAFPALLKDTNMTTVAVENLTKANQGLSASFKSQAEVMQQVQIQLTKLQAAGSLRLSGNNNQQIEQLKGIIREVSRGTGAQYSDVANQLEKLGIPAAQANAAVKGLNTELTKGTRDAQGFGHTIDVVRTALGTLTAVGIFQFLNFLSQAFHDATKQAKEMEDTMYRLSNTERILSEQGAEISMKGLEDGIKRIKKLMPIFSKEDIAGLVGQIAITTQNLGFSEKQILDLAQAVTVLNINSSETETLQTTAQHVLSSMITDNAKGVANLGLDMSKAAIEAKALGMNLLVPGESVDSLSEYEKNMVKAQIAIDTAANSMASLNGYMTTNTARAQQNTAAWNDMLTTWGSLFNTVQPALTALYEGLNNAGKMLKVIAILVEVVRQQVNLLFVGLTSGNLITALKELPNVFEKVSKTLLKNLFPEGNPFGEGSLGDKMFGDIFKQLEMETPTNPLGDFPKNAEKDMETAESAVLKSEEKITAIMQEARDKREDIDEQYRRKIEDANRDHQQKMEDIARETSRKQEDALRNYNEKVADINRDADEKIAEAQQDQRDKELEREREYQNKLRELRERFLFDLEDALRERDARQVLRLIREYQMDKKKLEEKRKLEKQEAKNDLARKLADIERERALKLEAAKRELAEKQAEIALWAERERADAQLALQRKLADARLWHQRELQEYQQYLQRKLQELAKAIVKEYQLTAAGAQAIYSLLQGYFGSSGSIQQLLSQGLTANISGILSSASGAGGGSSGGGWESLASTWSNLHFAEGGSYVATRPTKAIFGEKGPEVATFTPIGRTGANVGKTFGDIGQGENSLSLRISISNGLIAEIVDSSLENVAAVIEKIGREK